MSVLSPISYEQVSYSYFEFVAELPMRVRPKLERLGLLFVPESEPPFSFGGGPVASTGARLTTGDEYWLFADWHWRDGEFFAPTLEGEYHKICVKAAPEQFDTPSEAFTAFSSVTGVLRGEAEWLASEWQDQNWRVKR